MDYYDSMLLLTRLVAPILLIAALSANGQTPIKSGEPALGSALNSELFYQLLIAELQVSGGEPGAGFSLVLDAANKTRDAKLYQRAVEIALQARSGDSALMAARAWKQAHPSSREANRYTLQILINMNRIGEIVEPLKREITLMDGKERVAAVTALPRYFGRTSNKILVASVVEQALAEYVSSGPLGVAAWTTIGRLRLEADNPTGALEAARSAQALDPKADGPALLALTLMNPKLPQAEVLVRKHLEGKPQAELRMAYAQALLGAQRYGEASAQLQSVTTEKPDLAQAWLIQGTLELQDAKLEAAEKSFRNYIKLVPSIAPAKSADDTDRGLAQAFLSLAQIAEQRRDFVLAQSWLDRIHNPEDQPNVQIRRASLLARQGKLDQARKLLRDLPASSPAQERFRMVAEVQLLRDQKHYHAAFEMLAEATKRDPSDLDLAYDMAMVAEKLGRTQEMERLLRAVIAGRPDYHHAYNALGYSLAERNVRLPEARQLILKALEYAPDDPLISDSLGWVEFRLGNLPEAARILQAAFKAKPDAEIAAHLGEVMWTMGRRDQATAIWKEGQLLGADNETLLETLKRLRVRW
ncbi:MAG: tetratricopeptide repeat protein [Rhodoferax sp.]|nr:tetratricopeptide repeat protein [Rhodoferax sp.]